MATHSISNEGVELLRRWNTARKELERIKRGVNSAECELTNAQNALGQWMVPDDLGGDGTTDEQFNIWVGNGLLSVRKTGQNDYVVEWRKKPIGDCL